MKIAVQLSGIRACLPYTLVIITLMSGCAQNPVDSFTAKRAYLGVETRATSSEYADLGYSQEPIITAVPTQPFPADGWQVTQPEVVDEAQAIDIEPIPESTPALAARKNVIHAHKAVHRHVVHKAPAPMCRPEKSSGAAS